MTNLFEDEIPSLIFLTYKSLLVGACSWADISSGFIFSFMDRLFHLPTAVICMHESSSLLHKMIHQSVGG